MKTNDLQDPRLIRQVLGRPRIKRRGVPYRESIEYKIIQKKRELGMIPSAPKHQMFFMGEWIEISVDRYYELVKVNQTLSIDIRFSLRIQ